MRQPSLRIQNPNLNRRECPHVLAMDARLAVRVLCDRVRDPLCASHRDGESIKRDRHLVVELRVATRRVLRALRAGLLFEAAYHLEWRELRENAWAIGALAMPGVVVTIVLTALLLVSGAAAVGGEMVSWSTALIFGGVIAATDPVAVTALFRELAASRRLPVLVESERLLNDGTSIVLLTLLLAYFSGAAPSASSLARAACSCRSGGSCCLVPWQCTLRAPWWLAAWGCCCVVRVSGFLVHGAWCSCGAACVVHSRWHWRSRCRQMPATVR